MGFDLRSLEEISVAQLCGMCGGVHAESAGELCPWVYQKLALVAESLSAGYHFSPKNDADTTFVA
jgi:hypothetical protein